MEFEKVVFERRTIRRFKPKEVAVSLLEKLVDYARVAPTGSNIQSIEYILILSKDVREKLFSMIYWAGSLAKDQRTPEKERTPMAYIVVLVNRKVKKGADFDVGAAVQNILLGATSHGLGACWMGAIEKDKIRTLLEVPDFYEVKFVISLGFPDEKSVIEPFQGDFKYWKDEEGTMHVPKKSVKQSIFSVK